MKLKQTKPFHSSLTIRVSSFFFLVFCFVFPLGSSSFLLSIRQYICLEVKWLPSPKIDSAIQFWIQNSINMSVFTQPLHHEADVTEFQFFKDATDLNSEFSFSYMISLTRAK